jgi:hypothetical protein
MSNRETNEMVESLSNSRNRLFRRGVQHSLPGEALKTTGFNPARYMELYVPEQSVAPIIDFLNQHDKYNNVVINDWESFLRTSVMRQSFTLEAVPETAKAKEKTPNVIVENEPPRVKAPVKETALVA